MTVQTQRLGAAREWVMETKYLVRYTQHLQNTLYWVGYDDEGEQDWTMWPEHATRLEESDAIQLAEDFDATAIVAE